MKSSGGGGVKVREGVGGNLLCISTSKKGAPHAIRWWKSILMLKQLFLSLTEENKEKLKQSQSKKLLFSDFQQSHIMFMKNFVSTYAQLSFLFYF